MLGSVAKLFNVDSTIHQDERLIDADQAARILGVRKQTLYAYVSRGLIRSHGAARSKGSLYAADEIARLRARSQARAGHTAVAAGALRFGEPVLDSAITNVGPRGPVYRGHVAVDLMQSDVSYETVAELLWTGVLPQTAVRWPALPPPKRQWRSAHDDVFLRLADSLSLASAHDPTRHQAPHLAELDRARALLPLLASALAPTTAPEPRDTSFAGRVAISLGLSPSARVRRALDGMLVLVADHELNASSFGARVAASTGADLYACLAAALAVASGPLHGAAAARVESLLDEITSPAQARAVIESRARRGENIPGFGHPLYPTGDPRALPLLALAGRLAPRSRRVATLLSVCRVMAQSRRGLPNVDLALVAMCDALHAPRGSASTVFVLGRTAGWVAHALEQRTAGFLLRPRARYVGPPPVLVSA